MTEPKHIVLDVPGVSCSHCKMAIEGALRGLDGVISATVDVGTKSVDVVFDGERADRQRIESAIAGEGYAVAGVRPS